MEERALEELREQHKDVDDETKGAREFVGDVARGIGGGWSTKGRAFRENYDRIFGKKGIPDEGSIQGRGAADGNPHGGSG